MWSPFYLCHTPLRGLTRGERERKRGEEQERERGIEREGEREGKKPLLILLSPRKTWDRAWGRAIQVNSRLLASGQRWRQGFICAGASSGTSRMGTDTYWLNPAPLSLSKSIYTFCVIFNVICSVVLLFPIRATRKSLVCLCWGHWKLIFFSFKERERCCSGHTVYAWSVKPILCTSRELLMLGKCQKDIHICSISSDQ